MKTLFWTTGFDFVNHEILLKKTELDEIQNMIVIEMSKIDINSTQTQSILEKFNNKLNLNVQLNNQIQASSNSNIVRTCNYIILYLL